jgi:hypothetical protein
MVWHTLYASQRDRVPLVQRTPIAWESGVRRHQ